MSGRALAPLLAFALAAAAPAPRQDGAPAPVDDPLPAEARAFLDAHCVSCHGPDAVQGDLRLDVGHVLGPDDDPDGWDWLRERVAFEEMPPPAAEAPPEDERRRFLRWLDRALGAPAADDPAPRPIPLRRLTRAEWRHGARDLFGVEFDPARFLPEDAVGHGFDHVADAQTLSEADFVRYLEAAETVAERAVPFDDGLAPPRRRHGPHQLDAARSDDRAAWLWSHGDATARASLPRAGEYVIRAAVFGQQAGPDPCRARLVLDGEASEQVFDAPGGSPDEAVVIEARLVATRSGDLDAGVRFVNDFYDRAAPEGTPRDRNLAVAWVEVEGPFGAAEPTPFSAALLERVERAGGGDRGLRAAVGELAALAWRLPGDHAPRADVRRLLALSDRDAPAEQRLRTALTGVLASPRFLFKEERGRGAVRDGTVSLGPSEVATRLAGLLWSSVPDAALLDTARATGLGRRAADVGDVARAMLGDPRSARFVESFGRQWLQLDGLRGKRADRELFPELKGALVRSMRDQTHRVLLDSLRERRSLWELVDGATTLVDRRLAAHYGVDFAAGEEAGDGWRRVDLAGTPRRGLLGHGSVLFLTSEADRTSPVKRGKWVLDVLLGSAPPPPPPGADSLPEQSPETADLSLRERFELHRADASCAACHARMDPIGFGLDAYDAIGRLRQGVDATGELPGGRAFDGPAELAAVLRGEGRFLEATVERLLVYALGRGLSSADRAVVKQVVGALDPDHPTLEDAILAIVASDAFLRIPAPADR